MTLLFVSLIIITCILLILIIMVQNPKGGGLSSAFGGGGTQIFGGVKKTTDFLDRGTWILSIALVVLVLGANVMLNPSSNAEVDTTQESELGEAIDNNFTPIAPQVTPQQSSEQLQQTLPDPVESEEDTE